MKSEVSTIDRRVVGLVKAERAEIRNAAVGAVFAEKDVSIDRGGARSVVAGGSLSLSRGGAGTIVSLGPAQIERGGAGSLISARATVGKGGVVLLALTPHIEVAEGGRVFGGPAAVAAAFAGVAIGFAFGALARGRRRSGR